MLTLTENASSVVTAITEQTVEAEDAGLRISQQDTDSLNVQPAPSPQPGDQVIEQEGARVFVDETAAQMLDQMTLDAAVDTDGSVQFSLVPQS